VEYLRIYALERAYKEPRRQAETLKAFKRIAYSTLRIISTAETIPRVVRVMQLHPAIEWSVVWRKLHKTWTSEGANSAWYMVMHDLILTNVRLRKIQLTDTTNCNQCGRQDTTLHRLRECGECQVIWKWTCTRIAWINRTEPRRVPGERLLTPHFQLVPPERAGGIVDLGEMVLYLVQKRRTVLRQGYIDFMRRSRWKTYQRKNRMKRVGNSGRPASLENIPYTESGDRGCLRHNLLRKEPGRSVGNCTTWVWPVLFAVHRQTIVD
jgi:hypothetical protein